VPLLSIANLAVLKLVVYIPAPQLGRVRLGAPVEISVDAYPGQTFEGTITLIAREAEFTPRNVQTEEERVNLVFAVEIKIDNEDGRLKPGMPADVVIETVD
jgi:HlyD family secretion protein